MSERVLVVGSGAREHALAWRLERDGAEVHVAPGNAGIALLATLHAVDATDLKGLVSLATELAVSLVVVGPEAPLVAGLVDALEAAGIAAFGPRADAARLEGSKVFSKERMARYGIPTAAFRVFTDADAAESYVRECARPLVVKADGLAAGKGVVVASNAEEACQAIDRIMRRREFGDAGDQVLVEECLVGEEVSYHVLCDGSTYVPLAAAQDHKRALDGDRGPNTGGMGAYSPPPVVTAEVEARIRAEVVEPTLAGMVSDGTPFRGVLFVGLMIADGVPQVLEYNVRFGDPECEVLMARWGGKGDESLLAVLGRAASGSLAGFEPRWEAPAAMSVVLAAEGYPGSYEKGRAIDGPLSDARVFHAGTRRKGDAWATDGGRVLAVTTTGADLDEAASAAYALADAIHFDGMQMRRDIGWRARTRS